MSQFWLRRTWLKQSRILAAAFLILIAAQAISQDAAPPRLLQLDSYDAAAQTLHLLEPRDELSPSLFSEVDKEGRTVEKIAFVSVTVSRVLAFSTKDLRAFSLKGEPLKLAETLAKLKKGDPVLTVGSGKLVAKGFRPLFRDDVIVLELPPEMPPK
jgi:hypothetical protein